jgi:hypothetical protein
MELKDSNPVIDYVVFTLPQRKREGRERRLKGKLSLMLLLKSSD